MDPIEIDDRSTISPSSGFSSISVLSPFSPYQRSNYSVLSQLESNQKQKEQEEQETELIEQDHLFDAFSRDNDDNDDNDDDDDDDNEENKRCILFTPLLCLFLLFFNTLQVNTDLLSDYKLRFGMISRWDECADNRKQVWKIFSSQIIHTDSNHFWGNFLYAFLYAMLLEFYQPYYLIFPIMVLSTINGHLAFYYIHPYTEVLGFSGAVFSLIGMNLSSVFLNRNTFPFVYSTTNGVLCFLSLLFEAKSYDTDKHIAYISHWTSCVSGFLLGVGFFQQKSKTSWWNTIRTISTCAYVSVTSVLLYNYVFNWPPLQEYNDILEPVDTMHCCYDWYLYNKYHTPIVDIEDFKCDYEMIYESITAYY
jgi:membrane associated rhomboid family serine protease